MLLFGKARRLLIRSRLRAGPTSDRRCKLPQGKVVYFAGAVADDGAGSVDAGEADFVTRERFFCGAPA
jgi:hypothetical protein